MSPEQAVSEVAVKIGWTELSVVVLLISGLQALLAMWLRSRLDASIKHEYDKALEKFRFDFKVREQAARVAEYMELARHLREDSPPADYQKANRLAWELAMWLPTDIYKLMAESLVHPNEQQNPLEVVVAVRGILLGPDAGTLTSTNILSHAPGVGKMR